MIYLERHVPADNVHRFYVIDINSDLFGKWTLIRTWGRIGAPRGQSLATSFETQVEADEVCAEIVSKKSKRGYQVPPEQ